MKALSFMKCGVLIGRRRLEGKVLFGSSDILEGMEGIDKGNSFDELWAKAELAFITYAELDIGLEGRKIGGTGEEL
jgi:hypothetical protein